MLKSPHNNCRKWGQFIKTLACSLCLLLCCLLPAPLTDLFSYQLGFCISSQCSVSFTYISTSQFSNNAIAICLRHSAVASSALDNREQFQWEKHDSNILDNKLLLQPVLKQTIKQTILHNTPQYFTTLQYLNSENLALCQASYLMTLILKESNLTDFSPLLSS